MRYVFCFIVSIGVLFVCSHVQAQSNSFEESGDDAWGPQEEERRPGGNELARERHETALARERARQAYFNNQARLYENQRAQQEIYLRRSEQEQRYQERSDDISNINQLANSVANVTRQIQVLSGGRGGW